MRWPTLLAEAVRTDSDGAAIFSMIRKIVQGTIQLIWLTPLSFVRGWWTILRRGSGAMASFLRSLGAAWILLLTSMAVCVLAAWPWFGYQIQLEEVESFAIRSRFWTFFALPGFVGIVSSVIQFRFRRLIFPGLAILALLLWLAGLLWPLAIHVRFHPETAYSVLLSYWIYPGVLVASLLSSFLLPDEAGWDIAGSYQNLNRRP